MAVRKRGSAWQADVSWNGQRLRRAFETKSEARQWHDETLARLERGLPVEGPNGERHVLTLSELCEEVIEKHWKVERPRSARMAETNARDIVALIGGDRDPSNIPVSAIDNAKKQLAERGNSNATINRKLAALSKILRWGYQRGYVKHLPVIERKSENNTRVRFLTPDEEALVLRRLEFLGFADLLDLVKVLIDTGMRLGEALQLEWRDVGKDMIHVWENKANHPRSIPMTERVRQVLDQRGQSGREGRVFATLTSRRVHRQWDQLRLSLGWEQDEQFVPHCLRHTFCSRLVQAGVSLVEVQRLAGHKTLAMTLRYSHLAPDSKVAAIRQMEGRFVVASCGQNPHTSADDRTSCGRISTDAVSSMSHVTSCDIVTQNDVTLAN